MRIGLGTDTCNNDMKSEMEMSADEYVTQTPFHLEPCGVPTLDMCR